MVGFTIIRPKSDRFGCHPTEIRPFWMSSDRNLMYVVMEKVINRSYRNRRIGDFLKELHITEGRSTGFPKNYRALKKNDSPLPEFETDEHNQYFLATIKIHEAFIDEDVYLRKIGKERDVEAENVLENVLENKYADLTERQRVILNLIKENSTISQEQMSLKTGVTIKTIQRDLKAMNHIVQRVGGDNGGHWEIKNDWLYARTRTSTTPPPRVPTGECSV